MGLKVFEPLGGRRLRHTAASAALAGLALCCSGSAWAMYKVVGPDGSVTYTDRPPAGSTARITAFGRPGDAAATPAAAPGPNLPAELRAVATRFPVTMYAAADCAPCDAARQFLLQRGVPFAEKRIANDEDAAELQRLTGARTVPSLTIGSQALRGYASLEWASFLDAAGYPREARSAVTAPVPSPLATRPAAQAPGAGASPNATAAAPGVNPSAPPAQAPPAAAPSPETIRF